MANTVYKKELLEFIYLLSKSKRLMNSSEVSRYISVVKGKKISDRTVRRWFKFLYYDLGYYSYINYASLYLQPVAVFIRNLRDERIITLLPHLSYVFNGTDMHSLDNTFMMFYLVPSDRLDDFNKFWEIALKKMLITNYELIPWNYVSDFYSPFHELVDKSGSIHFPKRVDNSYFTEILKSKISNPLKVKMHDSIVKNPLIVPIVFEYTRAIRSSNRVWTEIKKRLGNKTWDYIRDLKRRNRRSDGVGIKFVYSTMLELQQNFDQFFQHIRIDYLPFYSPRNVVSYVALKLKDTNKLAEFAEKISKSALKTMVYFSAGLSNDKVLFLIVTSFEGWTNIMENILPQYIDKSYNSKILFMNHKKTTYYWDQWREIFKPRYEHIFDPKTCTWKFDLDTYLKELNNLVNNTK